MRRTVITLADFRSLRRQLDSTQLLQLIGRIELAYTEALDTSGETENKRVAQRVIRMCIAVREADPQSKDMWADHLETALADADPDRVLGTEQRKRNKAGGAKTGEARAREAQTRRAKIEAAANAIRKTDPGIKVEALAAMLHDRGLGGKEAIRNILKRPKT